MAVALADSSVVIAFLDRRDRHHDAASRALADLAAVGSALAVSVITYAECMVRPVRAGGKALQVVERFFAEYPLLTIEPVSRTIGRRAAGLRARHEGLRLPDALILATAAELNAEPVLACDASWARIDERVVVLG